jgi:hypothetical protein
MMEKNLPSASVEQAIQLAERVAYPNLMAGAIFSIVCLIACLALGSLYIYASFVLTLAATHPALLPLVIFSKYALLVFGTVSGGCAWYVYDWINWQKRLESTLKLKPETFNVFVTGNRRKVVAELRKPAYPQRRFFSRELLPESCEDIQFGHGQEAAVYKEPLWQTPTAIRVGDNLLIVRPSSLQSFMDAFVRIPDAFK